MTTAGSAGTAELVRRLADHRTIGHAPEAELRWLASHGDLREYGAGEVVARKDAEVTDLIVVLTGMIVVTIEHGTGTRHAMESRPGTVTGMLPYSRMASVMANAIATEPTEVLALHKDLIPELIRECPTITAAMVHVMLDRARRMTAADWQDEKTMSLGRLAAGLAHELNNPVSAAARSAAHLGAALAELGDAARSVGALTATPDAAHALDAWLQRVERAASSSSSALHRADAEEALCAWLETRGFDSTLAGALVDAGVDVPAVESLRALGSDETVRSIVRWQGAVASTHSLLADIERATSRVHDLVSAVRRFAYLDRSLANEATDIATGLADTIAVWQSSVEEKAASVTLEAEPGLPAVIGNGGLLNQVWSNLLANALDAIPRGGSVVFSARREGDDVVVRCVDNGHGIPPDVQPRIFDPFFTTKAVGEGIGLGLDIARRVVLLHDGGIEVKSQPGRTEMRVRLPVDTSGVA